MNILRFLLLASCGLALFVACGGSTEDDPPADNAPRRQDYGRCPAALGIGCGFCCEQEAPTADPDGKSRAEQWKCDCERCGDVCASSQRCGGDPNETGSSQCLSCVFQDDKCMDVGRSACDGDPACKGWFACVRSCPSLTDGG